MLRTSIAALAVASFALLALPTAASAATPAAVCSAADGYTVGSTVTTSAPTLDAGGSTDITWSAGYFLPNDTVTVTVSGDGAAGASFTGAFGSGNPVTGVAGADGSLTLTLVTTTSTFGQLTVFGSSLQSACGGLVLSVVDPRGTGELPTLNLPTDSGVASSGSTTTTADGQLSTLAFTGGEASTVLLIAGGGALLLGGALVGSRAIGRRRSLND